MKLRELRIKAPVKVRNCHLRFPGEAGADQVRRRQHVLEQVDPKPKKGQDDQLKHTAKTIYYLAGETTFKAGEVIETDFVFPKSMSDKAQYADEDAEAAESADAPPSTAESDSDQAAAEQQ